MSVRTEVAVVSAGLVPFLGAPMFVVLFVWAAVGWSWAKDRTER